MKISELSQALNAIADEVTDDSRARLASVTRRVQIVRRSKVAGTIVTTFAVVAGLALLPNWGVITGTDSGPADKPPFGSLATARAGSYLVYKDAGGARLLRARVGDIGGQAVQFSVRPKTGNIGWTQPCQQVGSALLEFHLRVNGKEVPSAALESLRYTGARALFSPNTDCDQPGSPVQVERTLSVKPAGNIGAWRKWGVQPGQPATFSLTVTAGPGPAAQAALAKARLMLAVFEIPRHPVQTHGMFIDRHIVDPPAAEGGYKLVHRKFVTLKTGTNELSVPVKDNGKQLYVRTFVRNGEGSGVTLRPGPPIRNQLDTDSGPWSVEKSISSGPSTVRAAVAQVPEGVQRQAVILVYQRYL